MRLAKEMKRIDPAVRPVMGKLTEEGGHRATGIEKWSCLKWLNSLLEKYRSFFELGWRPIGMVLHNVRRVGWDRSGEQVYVQNALTRLELRVPFLAMMVKVGRKLKTQTENTDSRCAGAFPALKSLGASHNKPRKAPNFSNVTFALRPVLVHGMRDASLLRPDNSNQFTEFESRSTDISADRLDSWRGGTLSKVAGGQQTLELLKRIESQFRRVESETIRPMPGVEPQSWGSARPQIIHKTPPKAPNFPSTPVPAAASSNASESGSDVGWVRHTGRSDGVGSLDINHVTDHVLRQIDQKFTAWRERMGKV